MALNDNVVYFSIGIHDYSPYINELKITTNNNYTAQTNAAGNTVVDFVNRKRVIDVGFIYMNEEDIQHLLNDIQYFNVTITVRQIGGGNIIADEINCIVPSTDIEYYTIRKDKVMFKAFKLQFIEL